MTGALDDGQGLSPATTERLACDASVVTLVERDGVPLSVGRKRRTIPPAIRRALASRDRCCRFPGCERTSYVDAHHIEHWAHGGETSLENLIQLCRHHHRLVHEGGFTVRRRGGEVVFRRPDGRVVEEAPGSSPELGGDPGAGRLFPPGDRPDPFGDQFLRAPGDGGPLDLDLSVFVLACLHERRLGRTAPGRSAQAHPTEDAARAGPLLTASL